MGDWYIQNKQLLVPQQTVVLLSACEYTILCSLDFPDEAEYDNEVGLEKKFSRKVAYKDVFGNLYEQEVPLKLWWIKYYEGEQQKEKVEVEITNIKQADLKKRVSG